ncbi:MAG: NAD-dependent epimerase/dehydratase [Candidatus Magasanikbacteria bacterium GW2011_GWA2_56_11]|uniref:UDP-glucuronate decarboxylase n=1 Tax=Candidatus Magasanikbacteria bacterium GW2011_GWA2_56_11 TaxID=1619044 RepID=A0A0G2AKS2_9BACT|nr:MAG: NAD-dependent epimerase/dehydratase [Candidatus Magasanikbacteria bacterium GW2011_GWA2_56_11]
MSQPLQILVTGGAGFIGSHLIDFLLNQGHRVIGVDSFYSGLKENVAPNLDNPRFRLIKHDIREPIAARLPKLDRIYNLACPASPVQYQFDPILTLNTSVLGTEHMLKLARRHGARLLQASTSEVYGDPLEHPQKETYWGNVDPIGKRSCYDEGKRAAETLCKDYREQYGVDARIVRIFNTYGPRMMFNDGRVLSNFILQALLGEDITVHGDGSQTRSFMYVDDLISGLTKRMEVEADDWTPVNLGNPDERTIKDLAELVKERVGSASRIVYISHEEMQSRIGDPKQRCPNIARAQSFLGWRPTVNFLDGLDRTIADFRRRLEHRPRIAVFCTDYASSKSLGRQAIHEIAGRLPGWEFDVITKGRVEGLTTPSRINVFSSGNGGGLGTWLFSLSGAAAARRLHREHDYRVVWAITVGHGALAAAIFSWFTHGRVPFLLSAYEGNITQEMLERGRLLAPVYRFIFRHAHRWQVVGQMSDQVRQWLEDERHVQAVTFDGNWDRLAKNTKQLIQELEILSTRVHAPPS